LFDSKVQKGVFASKGLYLVSILKESETEDLLNMYDVSMASGSSFDLYKAFVEIILAGVGVRRLGRNKGGGKYWETNKRYTSIVEMYTVSDEAWAVLIFMNCRHVWDYDVMELEKNTKYSPKPKKGGKIDESRPGTRWTRQKSLIGNDKGNGWTKEGKEMYNNCYTRIKCFRESDKGKRVVSRLLEVFKAEDQTNITRDKQRKRMFGNGESTLGEKPLKILREDFGDD
jgi:hypothetical protein